MKCFIHLNDEAISVCKICGKAMCMNCSAYSNHTGICPECRRTEFINERNNLNIELSRNKKSVIKCVILAIVISVLAVVLAIAISPITLIGLALNLVFVFRILLLLKRRRPIEDRIAYLTGEIDKLGVALQRGAAII